LVEEVGGVELVEWPASRLGWKLLRLLLGARSEIHGREAGGQTGDTSGGRGSSSGGVVWLRGLVAAHSGWLSHGAIRLLRLSAVCSGLGL
jgi:hypothetical protein